MPAIPAIPQASLSDLTLSQDLLVIELPGGTRTVTLETLSSAVGGSVSRVEGTITGDGATDQFVFFHNLNTEWVSSVVVWDVTAREIAVPDSVESVDADNIRISFSTPVPNLQEYRVIVVQ